jgi:hypothetical protein
LLTLHAFPVLISHCLQFCASLAFVFACVLVAQDWFQLIC